MKQWLVILIAVSCFQAVALAACASKSIQTIPTNTDLPLTATETQNATMRPSSTATPISSATPTKIPPSPTITLPPVATATPMPTPTGHPDGVLLFKPSFNPDGVQYAINPDAFLLYKNRQFVLAQVSDGNTLIEIYLSAQMSSFDILVDGKYFAAATYSPETNIADIHVYDTQDGKLLFTISAAHNGSVPFLRYTPDGNTLISASAEMMKFWDTTDGDLIKSVQAHRDMITCMALSPDGQFIVTGSFGADSDVNVWSNTGDRLTTVTKTNTHCYLAAFSPDSCYLVFHSSSKISLYRVSDWKREWRSTFSGNVSPFVGFTPSGNIYLADRKGKIKIINPINQEIILTQEIGQTVGFSFSPDGQWIVVLRPKGYVEIIQLK